MLTLAASPCAQCFDMSEALKSTQRAGAHLPIRIDPAKLPRWSRATCTYMCADSPDTYTSTYGTLTSKDAKHGLATLLRWPHATGTLTPKDAKPGLATLLRWPHATRTCISTTTLAYPLPVHCNHIASPVLWPRPSHWIMQNQSIP